MPIASQIDEARKNGYSDEEISGFLSQNHPELAPKIKEATGQGYKPAEVLQYLSSQAPKVPRKDSLKGPEGVTVQDDPNMQKGFWESLKDSVLAPIHLAQGLWDGTIKAQDIPRGMLESVGNTLIKAGAGNLQGAAGDVAGQVLLAKGPGMALKGVKAAVNTPGVVPTAMGVGATMSGHPYVGVPLAASGIADLAEHLQKPAAAPSVPEPAPLAPAVETARVQNPYSDNAPIRPPLAEPNPPLPEQPTKIYHLFERGHPLSKNGPVKPPLAQSPIAQTPPVEVSAVSAPPQAEPVVPTPAASPAIFTPDKALSSGYWNDFDSFTKKGWIKHWKSEGLTVPPELESGSAEAPSSTQQPKHTEPIPINQPLTKATIKPIAADIAQQLHDEMTASGTAPVEAKPAGTTIDGPAYEAQARSVKSDIVAKVLHENGITEQALKVLKFNDPIWTTIFEGVGENGPGSFSGDPTATVHQTILKLRRLEKAGKKAAPTPIPKPTAAEAAAALADAMKESGSLPETTPKVRRTRPAK